MRYVPVFIAAAGLALVGLAAEAGNHKPGKGRSGGVAQGLDCPPGLTKKNPPCVPPGQARKYRRGDIIDGDYWIVRRPGRHGLDPHYTYYRVGDHVYHVDRETREVLDLIGAAARVLD
ncbi:excinuclease ABC subunit A [Roseovarius sp. MMSF_3281]|uniref:excinuclease ABC subunit A n=1 Tax=Roseovarius sp. MMSF_3281 TaxID=3046694 RepID=UPI00273F24FE|nr:excinuclease ABC subunit A [Roseovarius sp. MMSF_3281]